MTVQTSGELKRLCVGHLGLRNFPENRIVISERFKMDYKTSKKIYILLLLIFCFGAPAKAENDASTINSKDEIEKGNFDLM